MNTNKFSLEDSISDDSSSKASDIRPTNSRLFMRDQSAEEEDFSENKDSHEDISSENSNLTSSTAEKLKNSDEELRKEAYHDLDAIKEDYNSTIKSIFQKRDQRFENLRESIEAGNHPLIAKKIENIKRKRDGSVENAQKRWQSERQRILEMHRYESHHINKEWVNRRVNMEEKMINSVIEAERFAKSQLSRASESDTDFHGEVISRALNIRSERIERMKTEQEPFSSPYFTLPLRLDQKGTELALDYDLAEIRAGISGCPINLGTPPVIGHGLVMINGNNTTYPNNKLVYRDMFEELPDTPPKTPSNDPPTRPPSKIKVLISPSCIIIGSQEPIYLDQSVNVTDNQVRFQYEGTICALDESKAAVQVLRSDGSKKRIRASQIRSGKIQIIPSLGKVETKPVM